MAITAYLNRRLTRLDNVVHEISAEPLVEGLHHQIGFDFGRGGFVRGDEIQQERLCLRLALSLVDLLQLVDLVEVGCDAGLIARGFLVQAHALHI